MGLKQKGKIVEWNPSKGFGFIRSQFNSNNIFIHISDFIDKQYNPKIGDIIAYEVGNGKNNKKKAINAMQEGDFTSKNIYKKKSRMKNKYYILLILLPILFFSLGKEVINKVESSSQENYYETPADNSYNAYDYKSVEDYTIKKEVEKEINSDEGMLLIPKGISSFYNKDVKKPDMSNISYRHTSKNVNRKKEVKNNRYTCDGRQHCSQMKSCDEAKYFIRHCPNTKMDGDGDGVPCERQWCGY